MPAERCQPKSQGKGKDFMSSDAGTGQAMQVMTQKKLGAEPRAPRLFAARRPTL